MRALSNSFIGIIEPLDQGRYCARSAHPLQRTRGTEPHPRVFVVQARDQRSHRFGILDGRQGPGGVDASTIATVMHQDLDERRDRATVSIIHHHFRDHATDILVGIRAQRGNQSLGKGFGSNAHAAQNPSRLDTNVGILRTHGADQRSNRSLGLQCL